MPTRTEIIEAGAGAVAALEWGSSNGGVDPSDDQIAEATLSAMLPLIKDQLAAQVRDGSQIIHTPEGVPFRMNEPAALIIERYEPTP